jgi:hypothetical protein
MTSNLNVGALIVRGSLQWNDATNALLSQSTFLCAGYIAVEQHGNWNMTIQDSNASAWVYIKDNGAIHPNLRSRAFGGVAINGDDYPVIDIHGRALLRTWSLLSEPLQIGSNTMKLLHNPTYMGWKIGDRIAIAPTKPRSEGFGAEFVILFINVYDGSITLSDNSPDTFDADFIPPVHHNSGKPALKSAEVVNLSRSIVITGDDFRHVPCDDTLPEAVPGEQTSVLGCKCASFRSQCTMGLHTVHMHGGVSRIQHTRIEKCGQRGKTIDTFLQSLLRQNSCTLTKPKQNLSNIGVEGKYCLHFHKMGDCPPSKCLYKGNTIENSHARGIIIHGTHRSETSDNVLYNVRGSNIYIEDGNEMFNRILYNIMICNFPFNHPQLHGCTVPGTSNAIADTSDNQSGIFTRAATNDLIGNRAANSFNGMLLQAFGMGRGNENVGKVCEADARFGRWVGNTFHSHGRFGTYS